MSSNLDHQVNKWGELLSSGTGTQMTVNPTRLGNLKTHILYLVKYKGVELLKQAYHRKAVDDLIKFFAYSPYGMGVEPIKYQRHGVAAPETGFMSDQEVRLWVIELSYILYDCLKSTAFNTPSLKTKGKTSNIIGVVIMRLADSLRDVTIGNERING